MRLRRVFSLAALAALLAAQQTIPREEMQLLSADYWPPSQAKISVETRVVEVSAVVRDSHGRTVSGLTKDDFEIEEGGKKRPITNFLAEVRPVPGAVQPDAPATPVPAAPRIPPAPKPLPRALALVFDDFSMAPSEVMPARIAARKFLKEGLRGDDLAAIFFVSSGQVVPFTSDTAKLSAALDGLSTKTRNMGGDLCPYLTPYESLAISEHLDDTVLAAKIQEAMKCGLCQPRDRECNLKVESMARPAWSLTRDTSVRTLLFLGNLVDFMGKLQARRVIVMASAGFLTRTLERDREEVIDKALRANVVFNALDAKGLFTQDSGISGPSMSLASVNLRQSLGTRPQMESNESLAVLAEGTGGLFFHNNNDLNLGFHELGLAPEYSYSLGFSPAGAADNKYHSMKVRLAAKGHNSIQARRGYFAQIIPPKPPPQEQPIDKMLLDTAAPHDVPAVFSAAYTTTPDGAPALRAELHLSIKDLPFNLLAGVRSQQVDFIAALFDEQSNFVAGKLGRSTFHLTEDSFQKLSNGLNAGLVIQAPPGKYRLRCVVVEANTGKMSAANQPIELKK